MRLAGSIVQTAQRLLQGGESCVQYMAVMHTHLNCRVLTGNRSQARRQAQQLDPLPPHAKMGRFCLHRERQHIQDMEVSSACVWQVHYECSHIMDYEEALPLSIITFQHKHHVDCYSTSLGLSDWRLC